MKKQRLNNTATAFPGSTVRHQRSVAHQLRDQPSVGESSDQSRRMSGHEMLDQDFSDEEVQSEMQKGRAPPIEVQLMEIDSYERQNQIGEDESDQKMVDLSMALNQRRQNNAMPVRR